MSNPNRNTDDLKKFGSPIYRKRIKRMVEMVKNLRGIHRKLPKGKLPPLKATASEKDRQKRAAEETRRLTISSVHYFADTFSSVYAGRDNANDTVEKQ